jgi:hypothetical protein
MTIRPQTALSRLALAALFAVFGLAASAPAAHAQSNGCQGPNCLTAETAAVEVLPAPVLAANPPAAVMCDNYPDCLVEPTAMRDAVLR